jgi:hypothetical protein
MHAHTPRVRFALPLMLVLAAPAVARADRTPTPSDIKEARPPVPPPTPPVATPVPAAPTPAKEVTPTPAPVKEAAKQEPQASGGMCRVGAPAAGWELLVLAGLGLRARRRRR